MKIDTTRMLRFYRQFQKCLSGAFAPQMERTGLPLLELQVLLFLLNNPGCDTARDVVQLRGLAKSQVSAAVESLTRRDLLRRSTDPADRRIVHLAITDKGIPLAREAQAAQSGCGAALLAGLTQEEQTQLQNILEKVLCNAARLAGEEMGK